MPIAIVRCPYCVAGNDFNPMHEQPASGRYVCRKCGHVARPADVEFHCPCVKCLEARFPAGLSSSSAS